MHIFIELLVKNIFIRIKEEGISELIVKSVLGN